MSASMEACIAEHAVVPTPPLPVASLPSPLTTSPSDAGAPLGYREVGIWMRAASPPLLLPSTSHRTDIPEAEMRLGRELALLLPLPDSDRPYHHHTTMILDKEAMYARIAWTSSEDRSAAIEAHVRTLKAHVATLIAQTSSLQTQLTTTLGRIETLEARDPEPQDEPAEAGSSC
ncbi:hypothetical protein Tco_1006484 [Tanacetum coccineum]|uniref:Uncharacterized protein n=1 Tax=Tanacetum coccineum TaxID=301880 RepID=A0ABQ5FHZ6_9ASTR